jgi:hypothetical protein
MNFASVHSIYMEWIDASDLYSNSFVPIKLVFYLINRESFEIVDSTQHIMVSNQVRMNAEVCLLFPIRRNDPSRHAPHFVKIDFCEMKYWIFKVVGIMIYLLHFFLFKGSSFISYL